MKQEYYKAYDQRYKTVHSQTGLAWAGETPSVILQKILQKYSINTNSAILEIGCGEGQNALFLQKQGYNIKASDVSGEAINWCKQNSIKNNLSPDNYFVLDVLDNNLKDKFDCIITVSTLHMLVLDEDRKQFLDFIYNHLNKNGIAIITIMGDGIMERKDCDITKAFDLSERDFNNQKIQVTSTSCKIVNWQTFLTELDNSNLKVLDNYISEEISGFNLSMVAIVSKK
ncbi:MAG: class I SAM-dependent methyltransferase [Clostridia bacterium]|nr:class I SAM-dependent methyltransferase [Clostridia bacterium]